MWNKQLTISIFSIFLYGEGALCVELTAFQTKNKSICARLVSNCPWFIIKQGIVIIYSKENQHSRSIDRHTHIEFPMVPYTYDDSMAHILPNSILIANKFKNGFVGSAMRYNNRNSKMLVLRFVFVLFFIVAAVGKC